MSPQFRYVNATTPEERTTAFQLRYQVFVEELHYQIPGATPETGVVEKCDDHSFVFVAYDGDTPAGTTTVDCWKNAQLGDEEIEHFRLQTFARAYGRESVCVVRKAASTQPYRGTRLFMDMLLAVCDQMFTDAELRFIFVDCSPYLVRFYERMGARRYAPHFYYDSNGSLSVPMCIVMNDHEHLSSTRSPLLPVIKKHGHVHEPGVRRFFYDEWQDQTPGRGADIGADSVLDPQGVSDVPEALKDFPLF